MGRFKVGPIFAGLIITVLLLWLLGATASVFLLVFIAILLSLYLGAVRDLLVEHARVPPKLAFFLALFGSVTALLGLFALLVPPIVEQTRSLVTVLPQYIENWETGIDRFIARFPAMRDMWKPGEHRLLRAVYDQVSSQTANLVPKVFSLVHVFINIFAVGVMSIYLALQPGVYREWLIAFFPPIHRELVRDVLADCADSLRAYLVGLLLAMTILGALTWIGLAALQVPYALTFGVFTGLAVIIPFFGTLVSTALPAMFVITGPNGGTRAIWVIVMGVVVHLIEANIIAPKIMSHKVDLPPVLTIVFVLIVGSLLGPLGFLVAVPGLVVIMVIVRRILLTRVYEGQGFRRTTRERPLVLRVPVSEGGVILPRSPLDVLSVLERQTTSAPV